ncbi:hypothetical protein [Endozoicomonas sp. ISHI1]|uniref:hypothetical protein n=1 Tax=Endozoicomonas sp. ISHI1 TaxID=2825882 RepID=UPI00214999BF|nr:hypothetical protein [Endozoicomonas sp. ISHI1]
MALMLPLLSLPVVCQAKPLTKRFIVELQQDAGFPNQNFFIACDQHKLTHSPLIIANTNGYSGSDVLFDNKRHRANSYGIKTSFIESIFWQWHYATHLLVGYKLILTTKGAALRSKPYSRLPVEVVITVVWLIKSYWSPDSTLFHPIEQETASILAHGGHPFAITTMMPGAGHDQQQGQRSESSDQQAIKTNNHLRGYFTGLLYSDSGDGNGGPEQQSHNLGLNCFVHPCHGVCELRPSSNLSDSGVLNSVESSTGHKEAIPEQSSCSRLAKRHGYHCNSEGGIAIDGVASDLIGAGATDTIDSVKLATCCLTLVRKESQQRTCATVFRYANAQSSHKRKYHSGEKICDVAVVGEDGQKRPCGKVCKHAQGLSDHRRKAHTGPQICAVTVIGEDGQQRPCRKIYISAKALSDHKTREHTRQQTCDVTVVGEDSQPRPCGKLCRSSQALSSHKSRVHTGEKTCEVTVIGGDGKKRQCGMVCKTAQALSNHKGRIHTGKQICDVTVVGGNGNGQPCGKACKNALALSSHKSNFHSGEKKCGLTVVDKDGQQQRCGKVCKNAQALSDHKRRSHIGQKNCDMTLVGLDGHQHPCGKVCKSAEALSEHTRMHRKRKPFDLNQDNGLSSKGGKVNE